MEHMKRRRQRKGAKRRGKDESRNERGHKRLRYRREDGIKRRGKEENERRGNEETSGEEGGAEIQLKIN